MGDLAAKLQEELTCETVFQIGDIGIAESTVITWVIMAVLLIFALFMTHNLRVDNISKRQAAAEFIVVKLNSMVEGMIGKENRKYVPYLVTVLLYIGVSNVIGLFGVKPPTKDLNVTAALAIMSIILIEAAGIVKRGVKGWCKNFAEPIAIVAPINVLEIFIRPLSLCMRLFGNVLGSFVVMKLLEFICPAILPIPFSLYFDFFDGFIQAYVFVFLTSLFIKEAIE